METAHQRQQREARERKHQKRLAAQLHKAAHQRRIVRVEVPKDDLLRILVNEGFVPIDATRIIGTGHRPDVLTVMLTFD